MSTVLLVDDDPVVLGLLQATLGTAGHEVIATEKPHDAANLAVQYGVEAVVLDIVMPGRSGYEVLDDLRSDPRTNALPVLMLSALSSGSDRVKGLRQGADDYVPKPVDPEELVLRVERLLAVAAQSAAVLQGSLDHFSLPELMQTMHLGGKDGNLTIATDHGTAEILFAGGLVIGARFGGLRGLDALLALLEVDHGHFSFENRAERLPDEREIASLSALIMESAWLEDELGRRPSREQEAGLATTVDDVPGTAREYRSLPVADIWSELLQNPGISLAELQSKQLAAPQRIRLTVEILIELGAVQIGEETPAERPPTDAPSTPADPPGDDRPDSAVKALLRSTILRGHNPSLVDVLVVPGPSDAARAALRDLVETCEQDLKPRGRPASELLNEGQGSSLPIRHKSGNLMLHFQPLTEQASEMRARTVLPGAAAAVVLVAEPGDLQAMDWLLRGVEQNLPAKTGVMIELAEDAAGAMRGRSGWQVLAQPPSSLTQFIRALANACLHEFEE